MSDDNCTCGCNEKTDNEPTTSEGCTCGCGTAEQAPKEDVVA